MPRIPESEIERIKRETDLAALVRSRGIELKPHGSKDLAGKCPFHQDDQPSFIVTPDIALDKPDAAKRYVQRVFAAVDRLAQFPNSGSMPPEIPDLPYRQVVVPPCRIFYRAEKEHIFILYVMRSDQLFREEMLEKERKDKSNQAAEHYGPMQAAAHRRHSLP